MYGNELVINPIVIGQHFNKQFYVSGFLLFKVNSDEKKMLL